MPQNLNPRRILINDDGSLLGDVEPPLTIKDLKEKMVDTYLDTHVDALLWCLGNREVYGYESQVGEIPIENKEEIQDDRYVRRARSLKNLTTKRIQSRWYAKRNRRFMDQRYRIY